MADQFKPPKFEVPAEMRDLANKSVEQAKRAFDSFIVATHQATGTMENSAQTVQETAKSAARQMAEFAEQNVKAAFDHAQAIVQAQGFEEVVRLQSDYMKNQMSALQGQMSAIGKSAQAVGQTAQEATRKAMKPKA